MKGAYSLNRGPYYPPSLRIGTVPRLRKVQYSRIGVSRGPDYTPSDRNRDSISDAQDSHYSTEQLEQRARLPHFLGNRYSLDIAEGSNQDGRPPIQYTENNTAAQTSHLVWQREQGCDQPPLQQSDEPTLACTIHRMNQITSPATFIHQR